MALQPNDKPSISSTAIAALLAVCAGGGIGYGQMLATGNSAIGIGIAGPIALIVNNLALNMLRKR